MNTDDMTTIVIPVKNYETSRLVVTAFLGRLLGLSVMIAIPVLLLAAGIIIWAKRRRR